MQLVKSLYKTKYYKDWEGGSDSLPWIEEGLSEQELTFFHIGQDTQEGLIFKSELPHENRVNFILLKDVGNTFSPVLELSNVKVYSITPDNKYLIVDKGGSSGVGLLEEKYYVYTYQNNKFEIVWEDYKQQASVPIGKPSSHLSGTIIINGDILTYKYESFTKDDATNKIINKQVGSKTFCYKNGKFIKSS